MESLIDKPTLEFMLILSLTIFFILALYLSCFALFCYRSNLSNRRMAQKLDYKKSILELKYLIESNERVVTLADLVFRTQLPPSECKQFLDKLVVELDGDVCSTESGKIYYQFSTAKSLEIKKLNSQV